ncbi:EamA family transporter [Telmatospirillum sp.]|uniref:EamA family transporter n=1 Tax=Telmatospirillum sp. TaxID=2079197 RepID=UPI00284EE55A|nr:EamA family transporter [Telmatospirillum sp.]MDR3441262.1 EamA family transporter [Telmatospirillum sp.]
MPLKDILSALVVVLIWGLNFVVIKVGLRDAPPLLLGALRFGLVAFPAILFVPRPRIPFRLVLAYALTISFGQFAFLFTAIHIGMPTGVASLVLQVQAFFTLALSALVFGDRLGGHNLVGLAIAFGGLVLLASASIGGAGVPLAGFLMTLGAALSWAVGNLVNKRIGQSDLVGLVVWSALAPVLPFLAASLLLEGPARIVDSLDHATVTLALTVAYLAFCATLIGFTLWGRLLSRHPAYKVAPLTLMVPLVGLSSAWLILGEALSIRQVAGAVLVLAGLLVNVFGARWRRLLGAS